MPRKALSRGVAAAITTLVLCGFATTALADTAVPAPSPAPTAPAAAPPCADAAHTTICAIGQNPVAAAGNAVTGAPGSVVGSITDGATESFTRWVANGATYVLDQTGNWLRDTTPPQLQSSWWAQHYTAMRRLGVVLMFPFLMAGLMKAIVKRDVGMMARTFFVRTPLAFVLTGAAVVLTTVALTASDEMTAMVAGPSTSGDAFAFMHSLASTFTISTESGNPTPLFLVAIAALFTVLAGLVMFMELLLRSGVIYIALLFMPLALAASVWPGAERWAKRLAETLVAAILSKFIIVSVISLAAGALAADTAAARGGGAGAAGDGIGTLLTGVILLGLAAFAPYKLFRMLPAMETAAIGHMEGMRQRGTGGARAAVSAPRDALERLSRQRATESSALSGRMFRGAGQAAGLGAGVMSAVAVGGVAMAAKQTTRAATTPPRGPDGGTGTDAPGGGAPAMPLKGTPSQPSPPRPPVPAPAAPRNHG